MPGEGRGVGAVGQIVVAVVIALLVGGSAPWWWKEITGSKEEVSEPEPLPRREPSRLSELPAPNLPQPERTSISVAYPGDAYGCGLYISIQLGDIHFSPQGHIYQVHDVLLGRQPYAITGQMQCPMIGNCQVDGEGLADVTPGRIFNLFWQNTGYGTCSAVLQ